MENRGQKRSEMVDGLPADKRACNSLESRPSSSSSPPQTLVTSTSTALETHERYTETSSSASVSGRSEGDVERDSPYGSCDSDDYNEGDHRHGSLREFQRQRSYGDEGRIKKILPSLSEGVDPSVQLASLTELCVVLSFTVEDSISSFTADQLAPVLVKLAKHEFSPDIMLFAIRAITYLCDVYPKALVFLVKHDAVLTLCQRLTVIEYMDVAEQCLQALEKISRDHPVACLQSGAIMAVLRYIDFFSTSMQRTALSTVVNICKKLPSDCLAPIMEALPRFCDLLQYEDRPLVESVATCLIKIVDQAKGSPDMLNELCKHELVQRTTRLIALNSRTTLSQPTYTGLIGLLAKLAAGSSSAVRELFELDIENVIKDILVNYDLSHGMPSPHAVEKNCNQVHAILRLLNVLLPPVARNQEDQLSSTKEAILVDEPEILQKFGRNILSILIQIVNSGANLYVCYGCLCVISKLVHFSKPAILLEMVTSSKVPSFLLGVFTRKDYHILTLALQITETLLQKLSDSLTASFAKEGVFFAIDALLAPEKCSEFIFSATSTIPAAGRETRKCLCYSYISNESVAEYKTCKLDKESAQDIAKRIRTTHFSLELDSMESVVTNVLQNLRTLSTELNSLVKDSLNNRGSSEHEERFNGLLTQVMVQIGEDESTSTFELIESGIIKALVNYLSDGLYDENRANLHCRVTAQRLDVIHKRFEMFARVAFLSSSKSDKKGPPLSLLVRKLQSALSTVESFPVVVGNVTKLRGAYAYIPYGRRTAYPCLRVRFTRVEEEIGLRDYSEDVATVDPFCSLETIERFLWPLLAKKRVEFSKYASTQSQGKTHNVSTQAGLDNGSVSSVPMEFDNTCSILREMQEGCNNVVHQSSAEPTYLSGLAVDGARSSGEAHTMSDGEPSHSSEPDAVRENLGNASGAKGPSSTANVQTELSSSEDAFSGLAFYLEGVLLENSSTLYQELIRRKIKSQDEILNGAKLWSEIYTLSFKRTAENYDRNSKGSFDMVESFASDKAAHSARYFLFLSSIVSPMLILELKKLSPASDLLFLLKSLETMNRFAFHLVHHGRVNMFMEGKCDDLVKSRAALVATLSPNEFVNCKLSEKFDQQMRDLLTVSTGAMPLWCNSLMSTCPFIFSFETRSKYFQLSAFGRRYVEPQSSPISDSGDTPTERRLSSGSGSLPRKKFMVSRDRILESATKMMESLAHQKVVLEVEYSEEVGTGLGPTLEFYTLVSREFQKPGMGMWRSDHEFSSACGKSIQGLNSGMINSSTGLFPRPLREMEVTDVVKKFSLLGQIVAKAIQDGRVLDIPFSKAFYKLILGQELTLYDTQSFDPELGQTLLEFHAISCRQKFIKSARGEGDLHYRGTRIENLVLDFTLPGYPDYILTSGTGHDQTMVTIENLGEYVSLVLDATLNAGICRQVEAFKLGFNQVFPFEHIQIFTEEELERLLCGERDSWASNELLDHVKLDHGYTSSSPPIVNLLEIIQDFDYEQRRAFLQFVTGAPRLPPGGLAALSPKLTIVRKHSSNSPDADLPSVMTCANYLKLPPYSSKERMKEKLLYAITEGQGSFHLS